MSDVAGKEEGRTVEAATRSLRLSPNALLCLRIVAQAECDGLVLHRHTFESGARRRGFRALKRRGLVDITNPAWRPLGRFPWDDAPVGLTPLGRRVLQSHPSRARKARCAS